MLFVECVDRLVEPGGAVQLEPGYLLVHCGEPRERVGQALRSAPQQDAISRSISAGVRPGLPGAWRAARWSVKERSPGTTPDFMRSRSLLLTSFIAHEARTRTRQSGW